MDSKLIFALGLLLLAVAVRAGKLREGIILLFERKICI